MRAILVVLVALFGCVSRVQVCVEAAHSRPSRDWQKNDSVGASVCADVEPR